MSFVMLSIDIHHEMIIIIILPFTVFIRSAVLRIIAHLSSGVAGLSIAVRIANTVTDTETVSNRDKDEETVTTTCSCLSSLLLFLKHQTRLVEGEGGLQKSNTSNSTSSSVDFFSYGLCLEALNNLMILEAIPYTELFALVQDVIVTLRVCQDMRVLCSATKVLSTVLVILTKGSGGGHKDDDHNKKDDGDNDSFDDSDSDRCQPMYIYSSEQRMHVVHTICTRVSNDESIMSSLAHIFKFFVLNQSLDSTNITTTNNIATSTTASISSNNSSVVDEPLAPTPSSCDPSMWLLGNEFGMRTSGL